MTTFKVKVIKMYYISKTFVFEFESMNKYRNLNTNFNKIFSFKV